MPKSNKFVAEKEYIVEQEISEIDFDLAKELKLKEDDEQIGRISNGEDFTWSGESYPINIDRLLSALKKLKTQKCKYVEIFYHEDHTGYVLNGLNMKIYRQGSAKYKEYFKSEEHKEELRRKNNIKLLKKQLKELDKYDD